MKAKAKTCYKLIKNVDFHMMQQYYKILTASCLKYIDAINILFNFCPKIKISFV